jgi:hypothetical protein
MANIVNEFEREIARSEENKTDIAKRMQRIANISNRIQMEQFRQQELELQAEQLATKFTGKTPDRHKEAVKIPTRIIDRFAWYPVTIGNKMKFLVKCKILQEFGRWESDGVLDPPPHWRNKEFIETS